MNKIRIILALDMGALGVFLWKSRPISESVLAWVDGNVDQKSSAPAMQTRLFLNVRDYITRSNLWHQVTLNVFPADTVEAKYAYDAALAADFRVRRF